MVQPATIDAVRALVAESSVAAPEKITPETRLVSDLGIWGDDAGDLIEVFAKKFRVRMDGFVFLDHFGCEAVGAVPIVIGVMRLASPVFRRKWRAACNCERDITIRHLVYCAELGHWAPSAVRRHKASLWRWWLPVAIMLSAAQCLVGVVILLTGLAVVTIGPYMTISLFLENDIKHGLTALLVTGLVLAASYTQIRMTRVFLRDKEVFNRVSPVAE